MDKEQIIKLWKQGYSKRYIYDLEFHSLKRTGQYNNMTSKELKYFAENKINTILLNQYNSTKGRFI